MSPLTIDVKLFGIQPLDFDINWSRDATNFSKNLMTQKLLDGQHWFGKIVLALRSQLFLNPIMLRRYLPNLNSHVFDLVVQEKFIKTGRAVKNNMYLINLIKLCEEGNIEIPKETGVIEGLKIFFKRSSTLNLVLYVFYTGNEIEVQINQPQWAFFEKGFVRVIFSAAKNTSSVFLRLKKYSDL